MLFRSRRFAPGRAAPPSPTAPLRAWIPGSRSLRSCERAGVGEQRGVARELGEAAGVAGIVVGHHLAEVIAERLRARVHVEVAARVREYDVRGPPASHGERL